MQFLQFTDYNGFKVTVNLTQISHFRADGDYTRITMVQPDTYLMVREPYDTVALQLQRMP